MAIDFYRNKKCRNKLKFTDGEWFNYPENIQNYINEVSHIRFVECRPLTELSDIEDSKLSNDEVKEIITYCRIAIKTIDSWAYSKKIFDELKRNQLKQQELVQFFENFKKFLEEAMAENDCVYSIGE